MTALLTDRDIEQALRAEPDTDVGLTDDDANVALSALPPGPIAEATAWMRQGTTDIVNRPVAPVRSRAEIEANRAGQAGFSIGAPKGEQVSGGFVSDAFHFFKQALVNSPAKAFLRPGWVTETAMQAGPSAPAAGSEIVGGGLGSAVSVAPALVAGPAVAGAAGATGAATGFAFGIPTSAAFAADTASKSLDEGNSIPAAVGKALWEGATELATFGLISRVGKRAIGEQTFKQIGEKLLDGQVKGAAVLLSKSAGIEATEELVALLGTEAIDAMDGKQTWMQALMNIKAKAPMVMAQAAVAGGAIGSATAAGHLMRPAVPVQAVASALVGGVPGAALATGAASPTPVSESPVAGETALPTSLPTEATPAQTIPAASAPRPSEPRETDGAPDRPSAPAQPATSQESSNVQEEAQAPASVPEPATIEPVAAPAAKVESAAGRESGATRVDVPDVEPVTISARKAQMAEDRKALGLDELPSPARHSWESALLEAKESGIPDRAMRIAAEVNAKPRSLSDTETAGVVVKAAELKSEHKRLTDQIGKTEDAAEIATLAAEINRVQDEFGVLSAALRTSGTEKGRALSSQRLTIDADLSLIAVLNRARAAKGKKLSTRQSTLFKSLVSAFEIAISKAEAKATEVQDLIANRAIRKTAVRKPKADRDVEALYAKARDLLKQGCA